MYEDYEIALNESAAPKTRNICLLGNLSTETTTVVTPPVTPPTTPAVTPPVAPIEQAPLDAAGPDEETVITPEQTEPKSGPEFWIFLLLAFAFSGAWTAWKKQKA